MTRKRWMHSLPFESVYDAFNCGRKAGKRRGLDERKGGAVNVVRESLPG